MNNVESTYKAGRAEGIEPILVCIEVAAATLSLSRGTLYTLIREGQLPTVVIGARRLIKVADLRQFADDHTVDLGGVS